MNFGRIKSFNTEGSRVEITFENAVGYITAVTEDIINVFCPFKPECNHSFAIEGDKSKNVRVIANMVGNYMVISTSKLAIYVYDNFLIKFVQSDGTVICRDFKGEREAQGAAIISQEAIEQARMEGHAVSDGIARHKIEVLKCMEGDEYFYGLGDKYNFLNKKGYAFEMWNSDIPDPHYETMPSLYKSMPFLIVHREKVDYGIFFDNHHRTQFDLGKENTFEQCVSEMALAGFTGCEVGGKYPKDTAVLKKAFRGNVLCSTYLIMVFKEILKASGA